MSQVQALRSATSLSDIAKLLGFKASGLSYILYLMPVTAKYKVFDVPKRQGGSRRICAPSPELKLLQRRLSELLQNCVEEINKEQGRKDEIAHGFKRNRSILTNAKKHRHRRFVFNIDIQDFFGTVNFGRVRGFFIRNQDFALDPKAATVLAQIACHQNSLPQGSPSSPVISNLIAHILDVHLVRLATQCGCTYSRYADDLTFSTNQKKFPEAIATREGASSHQWIPGADLTRILKRSGFTLNPKKIRMQYCDSRQEVTGLVVNRKLNVRSEYRHLVRAMVHRLFTKGRFDIVHTTCGEDGKKVKSSVAGTLNQLHGKLGFIDGIDLYNSESGLRNGGRKNDRSTKELMYRRFLLFKEFYSAEAPVIVCEGETDNIYVLHALRALAARFPDLAQIATDKTVELKVRIYKYANSSTGRILGLSGGATPLNKFIWQYREQVKRFKAPGQRYPIILLVDNDGGAQSIYNSVKNITGTKPTGTESFVHITANMYLVAIPLSSGKKLSRIEDLFETSVLATKIGGKAFSPEQNFDTSKYYGKKVFAYKVVRAQADTIDFGGFAGLFSNVSAVLRTHRKKHPDST